MDIKKHMSLSLKFFGDSYAGLVSDKFSKRAFTLQTIPYRYTQKDADDIASIVISGNLHHEGGHHIVDLEREFAQFTRSTHAIATNSGTSALMLACQSMGLKRGDEIIVPAYTFVAVAQSVLAAGASPVFADIDDTFNIDPLSILRLINNKTRAIIVAHMFGNVARMDAIMKIARKYRLSVIEDCAQAVGASHRGGSVGSIGDVGCFSFNIKKAIPTGQGGIVVTSNNELYERMLAARNTGIEVKNGITDVVSLGGTYFMTEMEAALARSVLRQLASLNAARKKNYEYLMELLRPLADYLQSYKILARTEPSYFRLSFLLNLDKLPCLRDQFIDAMQKEGVPLKKFYPTPLYHYSVFQKMYGMNHLRLPNAERFFERHIGMEFSPYCTLSDMRRVAKAFDTVIRFYI